MKGISPMIAAVLLIAFTVGMGGIISVWLTTVTTQQTGIVSSESDKVAKCGSTALVVESVKYKLGHNLVNVTVKNAAGTQPLRNLTVTVTGGGLTNSSSTLYTTSDFQIGETTSFQVNVSGGATLPPDTVTARAVCQTDFPRTGTCKSGEACMKAG